MQNNTWTVDYGNGDCEWIAIERHGTWCVQDEAGMVWCPDDGNEPAGAEDAIDMALDGATGKWRQ